MAQARAISCPDCGNLNPKEAAECLRCGKPFVQVVELEDPFSLAGTVIEGKYRIDRLIGEGGYGVVYRGYHLDFALPIAIKCLKVPAHFTSEAKALFLDRFREEGKTLAKLSDHPTCVQAFDFGLTVTKTGLSIPYLILEWLEGEDLEVHLRRRGSRLSEAEAVKLLRPVVDLMAFAHGHGIAHRDLKPANIYLSTAAGGPEPVVKVLDFGIAKAMQEGETVTQLATKTSSGFSAFSPPYGAPEQFRSKKFGPTGPWTDVHALGLILVELVTGRLAFEGEDHGDFFLASINEKRPTPRTRGAKHVSDGLERLCRKALARAPTERFAHAGELLAELDQLEPSNAEAPPDTVPDPDAGPPPVTVPEPPAFTRTPKQASSGAVAGSEPAAGGEPAAAAAAEQPATSAPVAYTPSVEAAPPLDEVEEPSPPAVRQPAPRTGWRRRRVWLGGAAAGLVIAAAVLLFIAAPWSSKTRSKRPGKQAASSAQDETLCAQAKQADDEAGWRKYLAQQPQGACAALAQERLAALALGPRQRLIELVGRYLGAAEGGGDKAAMLKHATEALHQLAPEMTWQVTDMKSVSQGTQLGTALAGLPRGTVLRLSPGSYVYGDTVYASGLQQVAIVGAEGTRILVQSGRAVLAILRSQEVVLAGLYMNHTEQAIKGRTMTQSFCSGQWMHYRPEIKQSDVLNIEDSSRISVRQSELEGSGFIGVHAQRSSQIRLASSLIHDCISEAVRLESSQAVADNLLVYRVGSRKFKGYCDGPYQSGCYSYPPPPVMFTTAMYVDRTSVLEASRLTLIVPEPLPRSQAFEVAGRVKLSESLIVQKEGSFTKVRGSGPSIEVQNSCFTGSALPAGVSLSGAVLTDQHMAFSPSAKGPYQVDAIGACAAYGSTLGKQEKTK